MILTLLILLYLAGMFLWWANQGLFSAFLHLLVVIAAGALAFAAWEPLAHLMLGTTYIIAYYAWGLSLLAGFALLLGALRLTLDLSVKSNLYFRPLINTIGGGSIGVIAGVLTSGIVVIGMLYLPIEGGIIGYNPYEVRSGRLERRDGGQLYIPVDRIAGGFFGFLSGNAMATGSPMSDYFPSLVETGARYRAALEYDKFLMLQASPDALELGEVTAFKGVKLQHLPRDVVGMWASESELREMVDGRGLMLVGVDWRYSLPTINSDGYLRVPPTQVVLITHDRGNPDRKRQHPTLGGSLLTPTGDTVKRTHFPRGVNTQSFLATSANQSGMTKTQWAFLVPEDEVAEAISVRLIRLPIDNSKIKAYSLEQIETPAPIAKAIGQVQNELAGKEPRVTFEITEALPMTFRANDPGAGGIDHEEGAITSGKASVKRSSGGAGSESTRRSVYVAGANKLARLKLSHTDVLFVLRAAGNAGENARLWLKSRGSRGEEQTYAKAFVHVQKDDDKVTYAVSPQPYPSIEDLDLDEVNAGDDYYVYFRIAEDAQVLSFGVGEEMVQDLTKKVEPAPGDDDDGGGDGDGDADDDDGDGDTGDDDDDAPEPVDLVADIRFSDRLPFAVRTNTPGLTTRFGKITRADSITQPAGDSVPAEDKVDTLSTRGTMRLVRLELSYAQCERINDSGISVMDGGDQAQAPLARVIVKADGSMNIFVSARGDLYTRASLRLDGLEKGDRLYVYVPIARAADDIKELRVGAELQKLSGIAGQ